MRKHFPAAIAVIAFFALGIGIILNFHGFVEMDEVCHYLQARYAPYHPFLYASIWARPLFVLLYTLPAQLPFALTRFFSFCLAALIGLIAYRLARLKSIPWPSLTFVLTVAQPFFIRQSFTVMTEQTLALLLVFSLLCWEIERRDLSCLLISFSPLARPEGFFLGPLWFLFVLFDRDSSFIFSQQSTVYSLQSTVIRFRRIPLLLVGLCLWALTSWLACGSPLWFVQNFPWVHPGQLSRASILSYALRLPVFASYPILILSLLGLFSVRRYKLGRAYLLSAFILCLHSVFWSRGLFGTGGYLRYLIIISPFLGLSAAAGFSVVLDAGLKLLRSTVYGLRSMPENGLRTLKWILTPILLFLMAWTYFLSLRAFPIPFPPERPEARVYREMQAFMDLHTLTPSHLHTVVFCSDFHYYLLTGRDPWDIGLSNREYLKYVRHDELQVKELLKIFPPGTYVLYDKEWMGTWAGVSETDVAQSGFVLVPDQPQGVVGNGNLIRLYVKAP